MRRRVQRAEGNRDRGRVALSTACIDRSIGKRIDLTDDTARRRSVGERSVGAELHLAARRLLNENRGEQISFGIDRAG